MKHNKVQKLKSSLSVNGKTAFLVYFVSVTILVLVERPNLFCALMVSGCLVIHCIKAPNLFLLADSLSLNCILLPSRKSQ